MKDFPKRFPTITALCEENGIDLKKNRIPVVPGSHFLMGGIKTDLVGRSSIKGLYALGEAACTGIHGANRLASNSLLEGLFMGKKLADWLNNHFHEESEISYNAMADANIPKRLPEVQSIKQSMMDHAGIVRNHEGLMKQKQWLESFHIEDWLNVSLDNLTTKKLTQVFMLLTAWLITDSAFKKDRKQGRAFSSRLSM